MVNGRDETKEKVSGPFPWSVPTSHSVCFIYTTMERRCIKDARVKIMRAQIGGKM